MTEVLLDWIDFYTKFATKLLTYKKNRHELIDQLQNVFNNINMEMPKLDSNAVPIDIDPFTVFGIFNKGITNKNRIAIIRGIKSEFNIDASEPTSFNGIPILNNLNATFYCFGDKRNPDDIQHLWDMYEAAITLSESDNDTSIHNFILYYDIVLKQNNVRWNLTMGLYWIRPYAYINLDSCNRWFITNSGNMSPEFAAKLKKFKAMPPTGEEYLSIRRECLEQFKTDHCKYNNFPELSYDAWIMSEEDNQRQKTDSGMSKPSDSDADKTLSNDLNEDVEVEPEMSYLPYSKEDFLNDVYLSENQYHDMAAKLEDKMNLILQGPPGVGKTYAAKRFAFSIIGSRNKEHVETIQFHQNYSYEDFINGYRPSGSSFEVKEGVFYQFCKKAEKESDNKYFFIIDEINRGNISKIFGESFMLIEKDKRGEELRLPYSQEPFSVPRNVYIIGLMNTADRSLAMLDYALRRRFAFINLIPGFDSPVFKNYCQNIGNKDFNGLIDCVKYLNEEIVKDDSLGEGFCIGHSFFCGCTAEKANAQWLRGIVQYELVPLLSEYWYDTPNKVNEWKGKLMKAIGQEDGAK